MMSIERIIAHEVTIARGTVKQFAGRVLGNTRLHNQGRLDRAVGKAARAVDRLGAALQR